MQRKRSLLALISTQVVAVMALSSCNSVLLGQNQNLRGSSQLIIELQKTPEIPQISSRELEAVKKVVEGRINGLGIWQAVIEKSGTDKIIVRLPGVKDLEQAQRILGSTAQLEFRPQKRGTEKELLALQASRAALKLNQADLKIRNDQVAIAKNLADLQKNQVAIAKIFTSTNPPLTGRFLKDAYGEPSQGDNWSVAIAFNQEGDALFTKLTKNLAGTGRSLGIFLDNELISSPIVGPEFADTGITGGRAVITGRFTAQQAKDLGIQLRGGALPVPVKIKLVNSEQTDN
ncbi:preprotein translocase subunit SecD [Calothrix sp. PCC 7507]|nr:preprotein translocase subunit SecD [Calothrix sp. PCC 7507]